MAEYTDEIIELKCNLDDMTGEAIGFAMEVLSDEGALDVFTTPITMKKNRPAILLTVLCHQDDKNRMVELLFKHTSTLGVRETLCNRYILSREFETVSTPFGPAHIKTSTGYNVTKSKIEYEDIKAIAIEHNMSFNEAKAVIEHSINELN